MTTDTLFDYSTFPILTTARLILRRAHLPDAADVLIFRGDPYVQRFNGPVFANVAEAEELIRELHQEFAAERGVSWAVCLKPLGRVIGLFGFHGWDRFHRRAGIGYDMARDCWGQGYASEALGAMLGFGFAAMDLNRVEAETIADNHESVRMLERLGFQREGTRRSYSWEDDGTFHAGAIYGVLRDEFNDTITYQQELIPLHE